MLKFKQRFNQSIVEVNISNLKNKVRGNSISNNTQTLFNFQSTYSDKTMIIRRYGYFRQYSTWAPFALIRIINFLAVGRSLNWKCPS